jgi:hypothetical protein
VMVIDLCIVSVGVCLLYVDYLGGMALDGYCALAMHF